MASFDSICAREIPDPRTTKPHILPLYLSSSFDFDSIDHEMRVFNKSEQGHLYSRYGNPTVEAVAAKITALECYETGVQGFGLMFSSGMAALHAALNTVLSPGDAVLSQGNLYGGSTELLFEVQRISGIEVYLTDLTQPDKMERALKDHPNIRLIFFETPANPALQCVDFQEINALCQKYNIRSMVDNTFATPYLQRPFKYGIDFIMHSTTKYLNGHGNGIAGILVGKDAQYMQESIWRTMKLSGSNPGTFDAWLVHNGLKTLALRMDRHCDNAMKIATFLTGHTKIEHVNYLGLEDHPYHDLAKLQMSGFGGVLSFEVQGGVESAIELLRHVHFCTLAPTLGDVDTLIMHPASSSHLNIDPQMRRENGISDGLIRLSVGIESADDIISDLSQALAKVC